MDEPKRNQQDNLDNEKNYHAPRPYWKRVYHHWGFWVGIVLMTIALLVYLLSWNLALVPRFHPRPPTPAASNK